MSQTSTAQPVLYLSHGAPPLADDATWTRELAQWSGRLTESHGKPSSILMVSAHWENQPTTISSTSGAGLVYDFWGFPRKYYDVTYDAPPAHDLAASVSAMLGRDSVHQDHERGLDHGAYVPLVEMFPEADVPVLQMSMPTLNPAQLLELGRTLAPLRDENVLIVGSGFTTHNLKWFNPHAPADAAPPSASSEFDHWAQEMMDAGDVDSLLNWTEKAPAPALAHPRSEHWAPLFVSLGAALGRDGGHVASDVSVDGFWYGLSKRSWELN